MQHYGVVLKLSSGLYPEHLSYFPVKGKIFSVENTIFSKVQRTIYQLNDTKVKHNYAVFLRSKKKNDIFIKKIYARKQERINSL